ncbi:complexin-4-like [Paramormyrops kingsleyae]|uniref:Complexin 4a n=1 Tax=Paramormyrops kingsleyae TaxID=1676925 RepID=A0A3B3QQS9_9TELE|nr:complexin-4-like [Paramormyrops kingsleyae]
MAFLIKSMVGNPLKSMGLGREKEKTEEATPSDPAAAAGMTREEYEEYQKQVVEEKMQRDADFLHRKAERATLRTCLRDKYRLPKSEQDENMIQMAGDDVDVPEELLKMVDEDAEEEEEKDSILGQMQNLQNMDLEQLKEKAQATLTEIKSKAEEKCLIM